MYTSPDDVPVTCQSVKTVTVTDGNDYYHNGLVYDGTYDHALIRLRNLAASLHGDAVRTLPDAVTAMARGNLRLTVGAMDYRDPRGERDQ